MIRAGYTDKKFIVDILVRSFYNNFSVNYIIKQDKKKEQRIRGLMNYSFDLCYYFGDIFYADNKKGCALILYPERRKHKIRSIVLDLKFIFSCLDFTHLKKAMSREEKVNALQRKGLKSYLWFIGIDPLTQGQGFGTTLLNEILFYLDEKQIPVLLETSNLQNVRWYEKAGFKMYQTLDLGYELYFMERSNLKRE